MSATDRIRADAARVRRGRDDPMALRAVPLHPDEAEALVDLADAFRDRERTPSYTVNCDCSDCVMYRRKIMDAHKRMRDALARLDGEDGDG